MSGESIEVAAERESEAEGGGALNPQDSLLESAATASPPKGQRKSQRQLRNTYVRGRGYTRAGRSKASRNASAMVIATPPASPFKPTLDRLTEQSHRMTAREEELYNELRELEDMLEKSSSSNRSGASSRHMSAIATSNTTTAAAGPGSSSNWNSSPFRSAPYALRGLTPLEGFSQKEPWAADYLAACKPRPSSGYATAGLSRLDDGQFDSIAQMRRRRLSEQLVLSTSMSSNASTSSMSLSQRAPWNSTPMRHAPTALRGVKPVTPEPWVPDEVDSFWSPRERYPSIEAGRKRRGVASAALLTDAGEGGAQQEQTRGVVGKERRAAASRSAIAIATDNATDSTTAVATGSAPAPAPTRTRATYMEGDAGGGAIW